MPICHDSAIDKLASGASRIMAKTNQEKGKWRRGRCSCFDGFLEVADPGWYCFECAVDLWEIEFVIPIMKRLDGLRALKTNSKAPCGTCEKRVIKLGSTGRTG